VLIKVKVIPGAREDAIIAWQGDVLRMRVRAVPEAGKANEAVCRLLARVLGLRPSALAVVRGASSREKFVQIDGLDDEDMRRRLDAVIA